MGYSKDLQNDYTGNELAQKLRGDLVAAALSAILVSPTVTIIDRYVLHIMPTRVG